MQEELSLWGSFMQMTGRFGVKVSIQVQHDKGDFSTIEKELRKLEETDLSYDLIFGVPTY